jgi:branched-chain amino acid transport system ATP-binding protein
VTRPGLEVEGLVVRFGGNTVLDGVSFAARRGHITALIGPNGAGKTTALNAVSGFVRPHAGSIRYSGRSILRAGPATVAAHGVGRTFQAGHVFKELTVRENLLGAHGLATFGPAFREFLGTRRGRSERAAAHRAAEAMAQKLGLSKHLETIAGLLPAGAQKLVDVGRALVGSPSLLLADEPVAGLSTAERSAISAILTDYVASGENAVLLIDHDMRFVMGTSDSVYVVNFGKLIANGPPAVVQRDERVIAAYLGSD